MRFLHTGDIREHVVVQRHQGPVSDFGIATRRRLRAVPDPGVHVGDHRAPEIADGERRLHLLAHQKVLSLRGRKWSGEVLVSGEVVDANVLGDRDIFLAVGADMDQRGNASPIFVRSVGEKDLRHNLLSHGAVEQSGSFSRLRICLGQVRERENIGRKENRGRWLSVARGLCKAVVEIAASCSCDVGEHSIESDSALFVRIESLVQKIAQKAPVLRYAFAVDALSGSDGFLVMVLAVRKLFAMGTILSSPVVVGDTVYFGSTDGNLYAVQ